MMRAVVTGASGFLGVALVNELLNNGYEVTAVVRPFSPNMKRLIRHQKLNIVELDMADISQLKSKTDGCYDVFFHFAWSGIRGDERNNKQLQETNVVSSKGAVHAAHDLGCKVFVSSGSQAECGITTDVITEETPLNPICEYGKAKVSFMTYAKDFCEKNKISFVWARVFSLYGAMDYKNSLINYALDLMLENKPVSLSPCTQMWDYMNVKDAVRAIRMVSEERCSGIINIADGNYRLLREYILQMKEIAKSESELLFGEINSSGNELVNLCPDISILKNIGFTPQISFECGIRELIDLKLKGVS
ncbi:MAG: NAD(P)-dependent oxidoreductase [Ruminococcus sp.]|nr:NAD(P)-dependent oxidoreductase [Ruminococcus sp.]